VKPFYLSSETVLPFTSNLYRYIEALAPSEKIAATLSVAPTPPEESSVAGGCTSVCVVLLHTKRFCYQMQHGNRMNSHC
jgi:hypothetical protein